MKTTTDRNVHCTFKGPEPLRKRGNTPRERARKRERERTRNNKSIFSGTFTFTSTSTFTFQGPQVDS